MMFQRLSSPSGHGPRTSPLLLLTSNSAGVLSSIWLVIAPGIREDYAAWQVDDPATVAELRRRHSGAMVNGAELPALKQRGVTDEQIEAMTVANPRRIFEAQGGY